MNYYCIFRGDVSDIDNAIDFISKTPICHGIILKRNPQNINFITYKSPSRASVDQAAAACLMHGLTAVGGTPYVHSTPI